MNIIVRFDLIHTLTDLSGVQLLKRPMPAVPSEGQIVNIGGNPYRVIEVGWAVPAWDNENREDLNVYAYVRVQKASSFTVTLGGRKY